MRGVILGETQIRRKNFYKCPLAALVVLVLVRVLEETQKTRDENENE
jgi:hypothetical protein